MTNRIYLVTGAAGFLGSTVVRQLIKQGERVRAFVLPGDRSADYLPSETEIVYGDLCSRNDLSHFFDIPDKTEVIVLHIASIVTVNPDYSQKVMDVNVGGTENLIALCKERNVAKLVYCSSTGAIPEEKNGFIRECEGAIPIDPNRIRGCYSLSKALATNLTLKAAEDGLNACVVHLSGIMGPEDYAMGETTKTLIEIINGKMPAGINGSFRDFTRLVAEESGCKKMKIFLPIRVANFLARILERKAKRAGEKPLMTTFSVYNLARNNRFDSGKANRELGYTSRPYRETIRDEIMWLKSVGLT